MSSYFLDHLQYLETEAIHVMREVAAEFERPALLFSGGKDSICLLRLAEKAFRPSELPMPLLNIDTGHHFPELNEFRDRRALELGAKTDRPDGRRRDGKGNCRARSWADEPQPSANSDAAGRDRGIWLRLLYRWSSARRGKGAREGAILQLSRCFRSVGSQESAPEIWNLYNARLNPGENMRVFPLSNWTEMDVWEYIRKERA